MTAGSIDKVQRCKKDRGQGLSQHGEEGNRVAI